MTLLAFILGLALGIGFYFWQKRQLQRQLKKITRANQLLQGQELEQPIRQQLLQVMPVGYLLLDEENQLLWCNEQARQLLDIQSWEPGKVRLLLELVRSYELDKLIERIRVQQQPNVCEWLFHPPCIDGAAMSKVQSTTLRASGWPLPQGQVGVFLENLQPIVKLKQDRNRWVSDLAHEMRTPLTSIRLVAEALHKRLEEPNRRWLEQMLLEVDRLINLVQNWLDLSLMEQDHSQSLNYQSLELRSLVESAWQSLRPLAEQKQISLSYCETEYLYLRADGSRLTQVFLNLFDNAIRHSSPQSVIRVEVTKQMAKGIGDLRNNRPEAKNKLELLNNKLGKPDIIKSQFYLPVREEPARQSSVQIDIIDSGSGFSQTDLPHVFERLYKGDVSRQRLKTDSPGSGALGANGGSGLGLSIVQQIVQAHQGTIKARNHPETGGAWLQIILPEGSI
ncbi:MAG: ATP-binding protein [Coleofasciculaceae cyanobacterium]